MGFVQWLSVKCNRKYSIFPHHNCWKKVAVTKQLPLCRLLIGPSMQKTKADYQKKKRLMQHPTSPGNTANPRIQARSFIQTPINIQMEKGRKNMHWKMTISCSILYIACISLHVLSTGNSASDYELLYKRACAKRNPLNDNLNIFCMHKTNSNVSFTVFQGGFK